MFSTLMSVVGSWSLFLPDVEVGSSLLLYPFMLSLWSST
jgi:hypothetical protein